jgi:predicted DNA-binding protein (UPF0251 family)
MTKKAKRRRAAQKTGDWKTTPSGLLPARKPKPIVFYGREPNPLNGSGAVVVNSSAVLDSTRDEMIPGGPATRVTASGAVRDESGAPVHARRRESAPDDPWLSPEKSEAVRALLVLIEFAQSHTYSTAYMPDEDLDLGELFRDAGLTASQLEVASMIAEGWGIGAIAERIGISRQAVSKHLARARRKLIRLALPVTKRLQKLYCGGDESRPDAVRPAL